MTAHVIPMQALSERQRRAAALNAELTKQFPDSVWITSPLPLAPEAKLRCQIINSPSSACDNTIEVIKSWGYSPILISHGIRFSSGYCARGCSTFEIDIEHDRQEIVDDRQMPRYELAGDKKTDKELEALRKHFGISK
jgi:hypothetical protein